MEKIKVEFQDWGEIPYTKALEQQFSLLEKIKNEEQEDVIVYCSHPSVVTLGRASEPKDVKDWQGEVVETNRGGRATYHGPEQLVVYPLLDLKKDRVHLKSRDVHAYLRVLEDIFISVLKEFGVEATSEPETLLKKEDTHWTGIWIGDKKLGSIGVAVKNWITHHGVALNFKKDDKAFVGIQACGFQSQVMTSLEELNYNISINDFKKHLSSKFKEVFEKI